MAMDEFPMIDFNMGLGMEREMDLSTLSSSTTTTSFEDEAYWNTSCSPLLDWSDIFTTGDVDFHCLIDSMMEIEGTDSDPSPVSTESGSSSEMAMSVDEEEVNKSEDSKGLRLVHLLMAAAEALTGSNPNRELARVILSRLKELVSPTDGTNMERLAAYFSDALSTMVDCGTNTKISVCAARWGEEHRPADVIAAFQLLQDMSPYVKFGHFTSNQAILEAVTQERRVHIVDYDIKEGIQWASLMQALVTRKEGLPAPHLRITALSRGNAGRRSIGTVQETGRRLAAFAASIGLPFSFHQCKLDSDETFRPLSVKLARGEALIMNCMLHLPHFRQRASSSVASFLSGAKSLNPRLITLVEEEVQAVGDGGFAGRFMDRLHHFSALYDSQEAGFPLQRRARALVEKVFLEPRIAESLARIYQMEAKEESNRSWSEWLGLTGWKPVRFSFANHCQANLLIGLFNDGYRVEEVSHNRLVIGWKSRRLLTASIWTSEVKVHCYLCFQPEIQDGLLSCFLNNMS